MLICIRENYLDTTALDRFSKEELTKPPYNFKFAIVPDECADCSFDDFELYGDEYIFVREKYNTRRQKIQNKLEIKRIKTELAKYDYIGVKIATGVATKEEYATQIAYCEGLRKQIRELEQKGV